MQTMMKFEIKETSWKRLFDYLKSQSMINASYEKGLHDAFLHELRMRVKNYQRKRSSSISVTQYKELRRSMYYLLDHGLPSSNQTTYFLTTPIHEQLLMGEAMIAKQIDQITSLWLKCKQRPIYFPNERYHSILNEQLPKFLGSYDISYHAHRVIEDLDYPLVDGLPLDHDMYQLQGTDLIYEYLSRFDLEQHYVSLFDQDIPSLLNRYEQLHGVALHYLGLNLCSLLIPIQYCITILPNAISLCLSHEDITYILEHTAQLKKHAVASLKQQLPPFLFAYFEPTFLAFQERLETISKKTLALLLLDEDVRTKSLFQIPPAIDGLRFAKVYNEVLEQSTCMDKIKLLKEHQIGVQDMMDLFDNGIFYGDEFMMYFDTCMEIELIVFLFLLHQEEFAFHAIIKQKQISSWVAQHEWDSYLYQYLSSCSPIKWEKLEMIMSTTIFTLCV